MYVTMKLNVVLLVVGIFERGIGYVFLQTTTEYCISMAHIQVAGFKSGEYIETKELCGSSWSITLEKSRRRRNNRGCAVAIAIFGFRCLFCVDIFF